VTQAFRLRGQTVYELTRGKVASATNATTKPGAKAEALGATA
jgi:chemotaxis protein methyltransferase CheR